MGQYPVTKRGLNGTSFLEDNRSMAAASRVKAFTLLPILVQAERVGVARAELLASVGLAARICEEGNAQVPYDLVTALWQQAAALSGDAFFGVHAAEGAPHGIFDITEYAAVSSATLGDALAQLCRYQRLVTEVATYELNGTVLSLRYRLGRNLAPPSRHASEFLLGCVVQKARTATGVAVRPSAVCFRHADGPELSEHQRFFAAPLRFGEDSDALHFEPTTLALPLVRADPGLRAVLDRHAAQLLSELPQEVLWSARITPWMIAHLRHGEATLAACAREFGLHVRTLQRQLQNEGETFELLLDRTRRTEAVRLLHNNRLPIAEISFRLGFSEPSAFHRAFKRWTGSTASIYQASARFDKR